MCFRCNFSKKAEKKTINNLNEIEKRHLMMLLGTQEVERNNRKTKPMRKLFIKKTFFLEFS